MSLKEQEKIQELEFEIRRLKKEEERREKQVHQITQNHMLYRYAKKDATLPYIVPSDAKPEVLDRLFRKQLEKETDRTITKKGNLASLWKHPNFQKTEEKRRMLLKAPNPVALSVLVEDQETPAELITEIFDIVVQASESKWSWPRMVDIINHKNFQVEKEIAQNKMSESKDIFARILVADDKTASRDILNKMLRQVEKQRNDYQKRREAGEITALSWEMCKAELKHLERCIRTNPNFEGK